MKLILHIRLHSKLHTRPNRFLKHRLSTNVQVLLER